MQILQNIILIGNFLLRVLGAMGHGEVASRTDEYICIFEVKMYILERVASYRAIFQLHVCHTNNIAANIMSILTIHFVIFSYLIAVHTLLLLPRSLRGTYFS